jgi:hypothetical protein
MAQPDRPNFSILGRIFFGVVAVGTIYLLLVFLGYVPAR